MSICSSDTVFVRDIIASSSFSGADRDVKISKFLTASKTSLEEVLARLTSSDGLPFRIFETSADIRKGLTAQGYTNLPKSQNSVKKMVMNYASQVRNVQKQHIMELTKL